jgi:hypothetical protein
MTRLTATLVAILIFLSSPPSSVPRLRRPRRDDRGSVTIEHVMWSVAVIAIVGIVVAAVRAYVTSQAGNIK